MLWLCWSQSLKNSLSRSDGPAAVLSLPEQSPVPQWHPRV